MRKNKLTKIRKYEITCDNCNDKITSYENFIEIKKGYFTDEGDYERDLKYYCLKCSKKILQYDIFDYKWTIPEIRKKEEKEERINAKKENQN